MADLSPIRDRIYRFWPLLVLPLVAIFWLAQTDVSMPERLATFCDARKAMRVGRGDHDEYVRIHEKTSVQNKDKNPLPYPVAMALLHYATTTITPQQTFAEILITLNILDRRGPCNFLVYGLGHDSPLWQALNHGGRTVFLEEDPKWVEEVTKKHPSLQAYHVKYSTTMSQAGDLLAYARDNKEICSPRQDLVLSDCKLAVKTLPQHVYGIKWDVIMIDAPRGYYAEAPGRMSAIYSSAVMAMARERHERTDVLLHDVERPVEKTWGTEFLCSKNLLESAGKLWHFQVPGEGPDRSAHFCQ